MEKIFDIVTFGESMVLFNPDSTGPLKYVDGFTKSIGGAESNVSIALSKLGHKVGWFSKLGDDAFGRYILSVIRGEGVDVSRVVFDPNHSTGILFKERFEHANPNVYYYRKNTAASNLVWEDIDEEYIKSSKILHITGITPAISDSCREVVFKAIEVAKQNNVLVSFDPNIRLKLWDEEVARDVILKIASNADIMLPGDDEGELLFGTKDPEKIAEEFIKLGCKIIAVKLGKKGCYVTDSNEKIYVAGYPVERVEDTVGAGDGFAAGFLSGYLRNLSLTDCAKQGNGVGAMAVLVKGDMEGYPDMEQLNNFTGITKSIER
ncbi:sugar kinase [Clostridium sp. DL1XJH146]